MITRKQLAKRLHISDFHEDDYSWDLIVDDLLDMINSILDPTTVKESKKITGKSVCPFCGGTKTLPYVRHGMNQDCHECDYKGMISNKKLVEMGLEDFIKK